MTGISRKADSGEPADGAAGKDVTRRKTDREAAGESEGRNAGDMPGGDGDTRLPHIEDNPEADAAYVEELLRQRDA